MKAHRSILALLLTLAACPEPEPELTEREEACMDLCALLLQCEGDAEDECIRVCVEDGRDADEWSPECGAAFDAMSDCIAGLTCEEYDAYEYSDPVCKDASNAYDEHCPVRSASRVGSVPPFF